MSPWIVRFILVLGWTAALPLVGFPIFGILTIVPLLGLVLGPKFMLGVVYLSGGVPAFLTVVGFQFVFRHWGPTRSLVATISLGVFATLGWAVLGLYLLGIKEGLDNGYVFFALAVAGAFAAAIMPLAHFAKDRRPIPPWVARP